MESLRQRPRFKSTDRKDKAGKRRRIIIALVISSLPAASLSVGGASGSVAMQSLLADPLSIFAARSPGIRGVGELAPTKLPFAQAAASPWKHSAPGVDSELPLGGDGSQVPLELAAGAFVEPPSDFTAMSLTDDATFALSGSDGLAASPLLFGDFSGEGPDDAFIGGSLSAAPNPRFPASPPAVTSVPESRVWLMMISGFFLMGWAQRQLRRQKAPTVGTGLARPSNCVEP